MSCLRLLLVLSCLAAGAGARAEAILGIWATEIDSSRTYGHVRVAPCGGAFCGDVIAAFDAAGQRIDSPNVGRRVLWGLRTTGPGRYAGRVFVPRMGADFAVEIEVAGGHMRLRACNGAGICRNQSWTRVR